MMNEGDPPPAQEPTDAQPAAPEPAKSEGSASFLRAARAGDLEKVLELLRAGTDINTSNANGLNSLHLASKEGHSEVVRELIKRQAQVDAATRKGNTALHIASLAGQSLIVTILVENGANVNVQSVNGFTPLYMAAQENHEDVVRYLLNHGANQALSTEDGFTPLAVALQQGHDRVVAVLLENDAKGKVRLPALHIAAKKDDTKAATLLLQNEHNPDVTSKSGFTPLHIAAHYGHENVGQLLLDKGANVNYQARHNISPLHVATKWGRINMANVLLARGAIIDSRTKDLLTPLHCAARSGHDQVVDLLVVQGAPISAKTKNGLAPLHMAAQGDHVDAARTLLYHRAPVDDVTVDYLTPLHVAAHCGHVRVAKLLLDRSADPNSRALNGFTPLHIACKKNRIKVVELLLKYRAAIEATTESGLTPLHVAAFMGAINIVIYLLQQGANPDVETVRGETPLHLAARANQTDVVRVLIRNGAKVDAQARELQTPLHIASRLGNTDIVVLLLQAGANSNATTRDNYSPLHIAAKEGQEEVAGILLDHNADKSLLTKKGFTPLHLASKYGNLEVVRFLLERGTPVDIEGKNQVTPLHVAAHYNNDKVAMLLLENGASAKAAAKNGYTPLHIAAKKNQMEIASTLLQFKADPNAKSRAGFTPLHLAAQEGHKEISGLLIENGSDVGAKANNGLTAMHLCAQEDHVPVAQILHDSGAEINSKTNAGYTPLHVACHFGQLNMVKFLVEHGADVGEKTRASYTPLHQAAQQGHNNCVRYLLENGASPNEQTATGQTPLSIAQRLGYVSVVETLRTVTETTVITETTTVDERYKPQNPEAMNETMFSESEDEGQAAEHEVAAAHAKDFSDHLTQALQDSTGVHMIHTGEQLLQRSQELENGGAIPKVNSGGMSPEKEYAKIAPVATSSPIAQSHSQPLGIAPRAGSISGQFQQQPLHGAGPEDNLEELVRRAQNHPIHTGNYDNSGAAMLENGHADNVPIGHHVTQPSFLISFLVDARGGAMRGCRHSGVRIIVPPRKASQPIRVTCRYLRKDKLAHPPPLSEGEELASRILEMAPAGAKFLGPVILEVPHFASLRDREREIVILRSDDGQHWKEHQLEATEDAVQEVLNESFDAEDLAQLDDLQTPRITRILTSDFPMYFAVVTRVRQEVHCVGPEGGVIISSVVPRVQAIFPDGSLTKTIKVSVQAQPVPQEMVTRLHGNRVAVSPIVTVEPRRRKFHKPITLCIPLPQSNNKGMLTQYSGQQGQEPPTLRLLCSITGGSAPAQWEDITGTTQLTFTGDEVSFTTTVSARFWLMDCQTPRDAARMAQEVYNEAISIPYMAKFAVFARRTFPVEGQLRVFCMTDDKEDKTLEKQEHFKLIAKSRDVEVLKGKHQFLEFSGNLVPITKSGDQLSLFFLPFQENRLAFMVKTRSKDDNEAATEGRIGFMTEPKIRSDALPPQQPICTLAITLPEYTGEVKPTPPPKKDATPFEQKYGSALEKELPEFVHQNVLKGIGADWPRLGRALEVPHRDIQHIRHNYPGQECKNTLKIWIHLKKEDANQENLDTALRKIGRDDIVRSIAYGEPEALINYSQADSPSQKRDPIRHFEEVPTATLVKREVRTEDLVTRESIQPTHHVEHTSAIVQEPSYSAPVHHSPVPEEPELEEEPVAELRTVVRTERHVHDTDNGPEVEEKTITTTYEDDVAINESITVRTVPLTDAEWKKWEDLNRAADDHQPSPAQRSTVAESTSEQIPDDVEQTVESESHREDDGTIVTTTVTTSHISESPLASPTTRSEEPEDHDEAAGAEQHSGQDSGTTQKKETAEEGFTNEDGSVVVSKKMTRVVTTTRTTLPGEGEEPSAPDSPVESLGSVKDRIAKFEQFKTLPIDPSVSGPPPSVHALPDDNEEADEQAPVPAVREHHYQQRESPEQPKESHSVHERQEYREESPASQQFHAASSQHHQQPESGEESDGEGLGSKVLDFAKKAGMVAGGVVAAPVALAAVGAKAAYDALKKDSDDEGEGQEQKSHEYESREHHEESYSPAQSSHAESDHRQVPESPAVSEKEHPHVVETTTTTTTITREFYDEPEHAQTHEEATSEGRDSGRSGQTEQSIPEVHFTESDTEVEKHGDEHHEDSFLEPTVGIVITPHTPIPPEHPDDIEEVEDEQPQEPLELSEPEHVARAEIKDTREYSDEELAHELSPSEEHVSTAEIKDIKSYSPTSSDDERKGKVSPPLPQVRHVISPSVASEVSSHDDELAAHFVAESFEKHDEGRVETIEQTPIYRGHHSPGQTSPIVSEHPIAQEYAESVTSHDEGDNISLKSGHEPEIARHSVASVHEEEEEEKSGLGDYAKKAGMIVGGVIAAPVALAAVGAKAAYDALKGDSDDEDQKPEGHEEQEVITTQTTIMESPIEHEDIPPPHLEDVTPKVSHHEHPHEVITETTTTTTREYYDEPSESPVPSEKEPEHHMVSEKTTTTTVTREFYDEPEEPVDESYSPAPSSHVDSERRIAESPVASEKEYPAGVVETTTTTTYVTRQHDDEPETEVRRSPSPAESQEHLVKETTTTTTVTREYEDEDHESESPESVREAPHVTETTTTTTLIREYEHPEEGFDSERLSEPAQSPEPTESEKSVLHVTETTTTTTVTRDFYEDPEHHDASPVHFDEHYEQRESGSPIPSERSTRSVPQAESPIGERHSPVPSEPVSEKDAHHVTETITTTTVTREFYDEPEQEQDRHLPAPSSQVESEHPIAESPAISEKDLPHVVETTTTTTVTREYEQEPEVETTAQSAYDFKDDEYPRPESPAEVYPIPSEERHESEHHMVSETTTTTTVTREFYDDPEEHPEESHSPAPSSHAESDRRAESPVESEKEHPHVVETTTTTTVTREFHDDDQFDRESTVAYDAPSSELEHRALESPEQPHVTETTTTTTVTREFYDDDYERPESQPSQAEHKAPESPAITERHEFHQESPAAHQFYTESASSQQHQQPESADESDGEGFGSKVLGFAKKAGMVAGGVVAAPVALAAVGAKAAYDALKKDSDDEGEGQEQKSPVYETREYQEESFSPASSSHAESEHRPVPESPAVSEKELPHTAEPTTESHEIEQDEPSDLTKDSPLPSERDQEHHIVTETTTVVTREYFDEPEHLQEYPEDTRSPAPSSHADSERHQTESPVESEKEHPHHVETTTTTTVTREYEGEPEQSEQSYEAYEQRGSPSPTGSQEHLVKETTTTTTVTREFYDEPEHAQGDPEESHSPAPSSHVESERRAGSPVESEKDHPHHVVETITTTTVSREFHDDDHEAAPFDIERDVPFSEVEHSRDLESPEHHHVTETTTTTTVTRDFYEDEEPYRQESPIAQEFDRAASPTKSVEGSEPHIVETTTTTTVTREYDQPEERFDSERLSEPAQSPEPTESEKSVPHVTETTTTTTVTRDFYEEPEHRDASPVHLYEHHEQRESGSPIPSEQSVRSVPQADSPVGERHSPVPSEPMSEKEAHHITETTTTTTVTREYFDQVEPEHREASPVLAEQQFEQRESPRGSPVPSEKSNQEDIHVVKETTTTTTVTREFYDEPEQTRDHPEESYSPAPSSHADSEHRQVPESPVVSEKQLTSEAHLTQDSPAAQYFHEQTGHQTESPIPTEQAPLLTQQQQPESGEESDGEGFGSKVLGFAKKAGMVAGGVVAAPVALAAVGAKAAYDALKRDSDGEDEGEQEALLGDVREQRSVESPSRAGDYQQFEEPEHKFDESPVSSEKHHVTETTTTTTTTREYFDEPESPAPSQEGHESEIGSQKSIPHVVETTTTTTVKRDYDEEPTSESPVPSEKETTTSTREVFETAAGDEPEHHYIETTTTTVQKEVFDEPQEAEDDGEPKAEIPHVVETTTTTKTTREYDDEEEGSESGSGAPHVTETTTTTTITREFYGDQPDEQLEEEPVAAQIDDQDVSPDSESVTSVSREIHADEPHVVETTTTTTVTREYHDEPEESEDSDVKETTTTTTTTREYFAEEPESPVAKEHSEEDRESPVQHVTETTTTTTLSRDAHEEEDPRFEHLEHREESPIDHGHEDLLRSESPVERSDPHVMETTTTTIVTREYEQPDGGFDSERLSEPAQSPEPIGTPAESEKSIPHVVETTTTTTVTREFLDDEEPEHREASPVHSEQQFQQRESPVSPRGSPIPSEHDDSHLVKETTTTTTVTREIYDEPEHPSGQSPVPSEREQEHHMVTETTTTTTVTREYEEEPEHIHEQESYSPAPSSHAESEHRPVPESPAVSEKQFTTETTLTQDSPAAQYFHEQPEQQTVSPIPTEQAPLLSQQQQPESGEESDGEGFGSKVLGFAKKAGMVAGGVVAAPVALAAVGAKAAYDALKRDSDGEDEGEQEALLGDVREQRSAGSPSAEYQRFEDPEQRFQESPEPSVGAHSHEFQPESTTKSQPAQEEDQESLKSPTESEQSFRNVVETTTTTTTTTYEKFEDDSAPASPTQSHKEELKQFQDEQSPESSGKENDEKEAEARPELERQGSYSPGYSPKSPTGSLAESETEAHPVVEVAEDHAEPEIKTAGSPVPSEEGSTKFVETTTTTTVTREYQEPEDQFEHRSESQEYQTGSPVPSEQDSSRVIETTTTTTVTREHFEAEDEPSHVVESQQYSPSGSPVPSEKSTGHGIETTTTTTVTKEYDHPEEVFDYERLSEPAQSPVVEHDDHFAPTQTQGEQPCSPVPSEEDVHGYVQTTTTTTTVTREYQEPEDHFEHPSDSQTYQAGTPIPSETESARFVDTTSTVTRDQESPVQQQFEDYQHQYSEEPAIAPYQQPTEYGRVDSHDVPASPAPSVESPVSHGLTEHGFDSERLSEPSKTPEVHEEFQQKTTITHEDSPASQYFHEQPERHTDSPPTEQAPLLSQQQQPESGEESDGEGFGSKVLGFAKKAGMVAGGVVAAPVALAAVGAKAAYDALKRDSDGDDEGEQEALLGDVREQRTAGSPPTQYQQFEEPGYRFEEPSVQPVEPTSDDESPASDVEPEHLSRKVSESEQSHHYTETIRKTTVTREYLDDDEPQQQETHFESQDPVLKSPSEQVVETTTTVIRHYHDEPKEEEESEEKTLPEEVTVLREVYEAPAGDEPEHHYIETKTTTIITKEVHEPEEYDVPSSPIESEKDLPIRDRQFEEPHSGDTSITTVTRDVYQEPEGVRPPSGSEADDESHAPRYLETTTTTTVTREYEVSEDEEDGRHPDAEHRQGSPVPSEDSVTHVVEKTTTTTVTEERYEPEESHALSDDHDDDYVKTTTTTTTVTHEHFDEPEHVVESQEYQSGSPIPSEQESSRVIETTTTTVTREHYEPEDEPSHIIESQQYSPSGSPVPSEKSTGHVVETTTTTTVIQERYEPEQEYEHPAESHSPVPSEEDVHGFVKTTTTTTTVTREHFEPEDEPTHVVASEEYQAGSPVPSEEESSKIIETTTTTTVMSERLEHDDEPSHIVESQQYSPSGSPVPSEKSAGQVSHELYEPEQPHFTEAQLTQDSPAAQYFHEQPEHQTESPIPTKQAPLLSQQQQPESGEESEGEGFGSKFLGFAKKAGMVAGGVVAAPVALAAVGAKAAYDALKRDSDGEDEEEQEALLGDVRERRAVDSETQEPGATFYEPEEEDKISGASPKEPEPKIVFPVDTPADKYVQDKQAFESAVQAEGPYVIESEDYEPAVHQEQRISSPVHSDSGDVQTTPQQEPEEEETPRVAEHSEADAPYVIDSEEYEFSNREEQRISSPADSDDEERYDAEPESYVPEQQNNDEEDPTIVESEEYTGSGQGSPRPFEESTTTTVISVHHEPAAIPEPEVDEEELEQDRSIIESGEYTSGSPIPAISVSNVEHVHPHDEHKYTPELLPTAVDTAASDHSEASQDPYIVDSEEYVRSSPIGHERPESPSGSPIQHQDEVDDSHVIESQEYTGSPVPSEESVQHVVEKITTTTTTEEHFEPEDSADDVQEYVKTTTTTTTVTQEHFEPEEEEKHVVESEEYKSGSPVPSEPESARVIETTTTTTVTREHIEPEDEPTHIVESQQYSPSGSPVPSEKSTGQVIETKITTTVTREHVESEDEPEHTTESQEHSAPGSPVPSEKSVDRVIETTTTTTVTREHVEHEDDFGPVHTEAEPADSHSPVPSEEDVHGFIKTTTTTTTVTREHFEPEDQLSGEHTADSHGSPIPSEPESGRIETRDHFEPEQEPSHIVESQQYSSSGSPVPSEKSIEHVIESGATSVQTHQRFEPEEERRTSTAPSEGSVHESIQTTSAMTSGSHFEPEHYQKEEGEESDGEGFGSKVLGFAKKAGMVAGGVVAAPVALAAVGAKAAYDALKKDSDDEGEEQEDKFHHDTAELQRPAPAIETHEEKDGSDSDGSFVDHGEDSQHLPPQSTEAAFKLSTEDVAEQTAEKLVSEVFSPLDRTLKESEQYRESIESLNRRSPVESKKSVEDLQSEAFENVTKISFGHADEAEDKHDDDHDEEWKVYDRHGEILEEFSTQLTDDVIQEAEGDATTQIMTMTQAEYSPRRSKFLKQESCQEISNEPEVDYYSDLQEKLNILAGEKNNLQALIEEEPSSSASDQLDVIHESDQEAHLEQEHQQEAAAQKEQEEKEEAAEYTATVLVDEVLQQVVHEIIEEEDDQKTMTSDAYLTATEKDDQEYDTCVTSQDDTYESAQGWTSQDSEYTTATSQAPSRLSDSDGEHTARDLERQETSTPQAMISPVDSDRQFTAQQDFEMPVIKAFDPDDFMQTTARSTPDVALQVTIEEEDESDDKLPISPSGILLPPKHDPGRPISPVPPRKTDTNMQKEGDHFVFVREEDTIAEPTPPPQQFHPETEEIRRTPDDTLSTTEITTEPVPQSEEEMEMRRQETERIHSLAMEASSDLGNSESSRYSRQLSDLSSSAESHADTVIRVESERSGSSDSLEVVSVISAGKDSAKMSEKSLTPEDVEKSPIEEKAEDVKEEEHHEENPDQEAEDLGFEVYDADTEEQQQQQQPIEELETVEEEPEDSDSLNEGGNHSSGHSSVGVPADTLAMIGKYRHQSSDNLSLTSLQEFERLEREVGARGDGSLTRSEIELLVAGRLNKSGEGSVSSLAEFERLEKEMTENQSPPEDVMMLSDIREESEAEDMSTRGDDEEDIGGSDTELKSRPVQDEDLRVVTPIAPSPTDSLEHALDPVQMHYLETSTDSLEPTFQEIEVEQRPDSVEDTSLTEYEMVPRVMEASTTDSLDGTATIEKDSVLEGASQGIESTQSTHGLLSGDTLGTVVTDDDRDSLDGEVSSMLQSYPTTLTTFQTTVVGPDGSLQTISRRVETRVTDPLVSHVTFTGTESQERLDQLPDDEQFETVDTEGNVTRTTFHREHDQQHPHF